MQPSGERAFGKHGRTITYDLPLSSIKEFRFQVSPYDWVEFRNVSLRPGQKTLVTVIRWTVREREKRHREFNLVATVEAETAVS